MTVKIEKAKTMDGYFAFDYDKSGKSRLFKTFEDAVQWAKKKHPKKAILTT